MIKTVGLNIITYNEAHRIRETLDSALSSVDEIVIVDQQSTDGTTEVILDWAKVNGILDSQFPMTVISDKHWGYCEPSRKLAWEHSISDWILVLDADERISPDFANEIRYLDERGYKGCSLKRALYVGGEFRWAGDYQYRFFRRDCVNFLNELHTEPQPKNLDRNTDIYSPTYVGIIHEKSWQEQIRDELAYEELINRTEKGVVAEQKLSLNVHLALLREKGITAEEADRLSIEERRERGIGAHE
jgi:glycosyltransferase involved in cell wall biosynthesis